MNEQIIPQIDYFKSEFPKNESGIVGQLHFSIDGEAHSSKQEFESASVATIWMLENQRQWLFTQLSRYQMNYGAICCKPSRLDESLERCCQLLLTGVRDFLRDLPLYICSLLETESDFLPPFLHPNYYQAKLVLQNIFTQAEKYVNQCISFENYLQNLKTT